MTDKYAELRTAIDVLSAETEGRNGIPWFDASQTLREEITGEFECETPPIPETDMVYIAAAHPETIRALLAERDALREALKRCRFDSLNMTLEDMDFIRAALAQQEQS